MTQTTTSTHAAELLPLSAIAVSKTNPRKRFEKVAMEELTASVQKHGVIQPILVRYANGSGMYELVAGERRYRAAKAAQLATIPALVRQLSDAEALELQVIENLQRADLHPLEEAEGYEQLQKLHGYGVEDLAAKVGKSKAYVYARLKLTALCKEPRQAFYDEKISPSIALLIARIPVAKVQAEALKAITDSGYNDDGVMSYREAAEFIQNEYMLRLKEATFDIKDATLVAKAGACGPCPKRTGNQPELFGDVKHADVCTDPQCFAAKKDAHAAHRRKEYEAQGRQVIAGAEAKKIFPSEYSGPRGYMNFDEQLYDVKGNPKARDIAKKLGVEAVLIEKPKTKELIEVIPQSALQAAMKKAGLVTSARTSSSSSNEYSAREKKAKAETAIRQKIFEAIHASPADKIGREDLVRIAHAFYGDIWHEYRKRVLALWDWTEKAKKKGYDDTPELPLLTALSDQDLMRFMLDCAMVKQVHVGSYDDAKCSELEAAAARRGIDVAKMRAEAKAAAQAKKKPKPKKAPAPKSGSKQASRATP